MLSRTADCLYWMARYTERAENTARMLDVNHQTSLLPQPAEFLEQSWKKLLTISKLEKLFLIAPQRLSYSKLCLKLEN